MPDDVFDAFGHVHRAVHGCGVDIVTRVLATCEEMLRDRGCEEVDRVQTAEELAECAKAGVPPVLVGTGGGKRKGVIEVFLVAEERVSVRQTRAILEDAQARNSGREWTGIVVSPEGVTPFARKECDGKPIRFFLARDLCFNVTRHCLVPRHERVDAPPEGTTRDQLPRLLDTDKVVQYYDWPIGTVVKVMRCFGGHEPIPYFRVVVGGGGTTPLP